MSRGKLSFTEVLKISRPAWWLNTGAAFVIGSWLATHSFSATLIIGAIYFLAPYNLLMHGLQEMYERTPDIHASGRLPRIKHSSLWRWIAIFNVPFLLYLFMAGNLESNVFLVMMLYMIFAYNLPGLRYREIPFIDSITSAFIYSSPFLFSLFISESPTLWTPAFAAFYFWLVGNHAFGSIQNIALDKQAGAKSVATVLGVAKTLLFSITAYGLAILAALLGYGLYGLIAAAAIIPYIFISLSTFSHRVNDQAPKFRSAWKTMLVLNYIIGAIGAIVLIYMYNN